MTKNSTDKPLTKDEGQDGQVRQGYPIQLPAPLYEETDGSESCGSCFYNSRAGCSLYDFPNIENYRCRSWEEKASREWPPIIALVPSPSYIEQLVLEEGESVNDLHLTLCALDETDDMYDRLPSILAIIRNIAQTTPPPAAAINGVIRLNPGGDKDVVAAAVDSADITSLREKIVHHLAGIHVDTLRNHGFTPHITLTRVQPDAPTPEVDIPEEPFRFGRLYLWWHGLEIGFEFSGEIPMPDNDTKISLVAALLDRASKAINSLLPESEAEKPREIKDVSSWDGSASRWSDTEAYCSDCLIDVNSAAGRDEKAQSHCMLPVREPGDSDDVYVRQAVFAAAGGNGIQAIKKPDDVPQESWDSAVQAAARELIRAYSEMDLVAPEAVYELANMESPERAISVSSMWEQIWSIVEEGMFEDEYRWPVDIYQDNGDWYVIFAKDGKLFRTDLLFDDEAGAIELGDDIEVITQHVPRGQKVMITRDAATGKTRVTAVVCTAVLNRVGEIDSTVLFDSFIERAKETGEYPIVNFHHQGDRSRLGKADFLARDGFQYIASYLFDDNEFGRAAAEGMKNDPSYWGHSIEFFPYGREMAEIVDDVRVPVYTDGVNTGISILGETKAAAWFTAQKTIRGD